MQTDSNESMVCITEEMQLGSQFWSQEIFDGQGDNNINCMTKYQQVKGTTYQPKLYSIGYDIK